MQAQWAGWQVQPGPATGGHLSARRFVLHRPLLSQAPLRSRCSTIDASMMSSDFTRKSLWTFFVEAARGKKSTLGLWIWERSSEAADLKVAATKADPFPQQHPGREWRAPPSANGAALRLRRSGRSAKNALRSGQVEFPSFVGAGPSPVRVNGMRANGPHP
jgi:hypothetical protein